MRVEGFIERVMSFKSWDAEKIDCVEWGRQLENRGFSEDDLGRILDWLEWNCHWTPTLSKVEQASRELGISHRPVNGSPGSFRCLDLTKPCLSCGGSGKTDGNCKTCGGGGVVDCPGTCPRCRGRGAVLTVVGLDRRPLRDVELGETAKLSPGEYSVMTPCHCEAREKLPPVMKKATEWSSEMSGAREVR